MISNDARDNRRGHRRRRRQRGEDEHQQSQQRPAFELDELMTLSARPESAEIRTSDSVPTASRSTVSASHNANKLNAYFPSNADMDAMSDADDDVSNYDEMGSIGSLLEDIADSEEQEARSRWQQQQQQQEQPRGILRRSPATAADGAADGSDVAIAGTTQQQPSVRKKAKVVRGALMVQRASMLRFIGAELTQEGRARLISTAVSRQLGASWPYFTVWIAAVHVILFAATLIAFGFAPVGISVVLNRVSSMVDENGYTVKVCAIDYHNLFLGPRMSDLIKVGAKYSICMRRYEKLHREIFDRQRQAEAESGCCIQNDGSVCYQSQRSGCPAQMSTWLKWTNSSPGPDGRTSGPVCGQDPRTCEEPRSLPGGELAWPDNIVQWPACVRATPVAPVQGERDHLTCPISARPCCFGIKGECKLASHSECHLMRGAHFPDKFTCSQADCLSEVCGMNGLTDSGRPGQLLARLIASQFLHMSCVSLGFTLLHHFLYLRQLEVLAGSFRTACIYFGSGITGGLVSLLAMPFGVEVGPSAAQVGSLSAVLVELVAARRYVSNPVRSACLSVGCVLFLALLGTLPWLDAFANLGGLVGGCALSGGLLPHLLEAYWVGAKSASSVVVTIDLGPRQVASRPSLLLTDIAACSGEFLRLTLGVVAWAALTAGLLAAFLTVEPDNGLACRACHHANCFFMWLDSAMSGRSWSRFCVVDDLVGMKPTRCGFGFKETGYA